MKEFLAHFPLYYRVLQTSTIYKVPQGILTITVELIGAFFIGRNGLLKTKIFEKKSNFPVEKRLWPIFSHIIEQDKRWERTY